MVKDRTDAALRFDRPLAALRESYGPPALSLKTGKPLFMSGLRRLRLQNAVLIKHFAGRATGGKFVAHRILAL